MPDKRIATGLYRTSTGFRAFARVRTPNGVRLKSKRFPPTATLGEMKDWRESTRVDAKRDAPEALRGTLAQDIEVYLRQVAAMPTVTWRRRDLYAWREAWGDRPRAQLTSAMIRAQLQVWRTIGPALVYVPHQKAYRRIARPLSASACNHRRTALLHLWTVLDGRQATNPVRAVPAFAEPPPEPRGLGLEFLQAAIARLRNPQQQARAAVLLWTGMRGNSELAKMRPEYLDLPGRVCHVPTGKGGTRFRIVPLNASGVEAWRRFSALRCWGAYDKNLLLRSFRRACATEAKARGLPARRTRVYDLRHSVATAYLQAGADLADVQDLLGHTTSRMTRRYAPLQRTKLIAAAAALEKLPDEVS